MSGVLAFDQSDPQNPTFSPRRRLPFLEDVLTLCSSLVTVSGENATGQGCSNIESLEVRLAHNSMKDYLLSHRIKSGSSVEFALEARLAHSIIAECCIVYLLQFNSRLDMALLQDFPLAPYAAQFWTEHYRHSEASGEGLLDRLALRLLTTRRAYQNCCSLYNPDRLWQGIALKGSIKIPVLYYASLTGLPCTITPLITTGADPNEDVYGCHLGEALGAAAYKGDEDIVQALLRAGAKPDGGSWEGNFGSPIASAAAQGHTAVVALLLGAGARVNKMGGDSQGTALFQAVRNGQLQTVKMLLDAGAHADAFAAMSGAKFAIPIAVSRDDRELVCLLFPRVSDKRAAKVFSEIIHAGHRELLKAPLETQRGRDIGLSYAARLGWTDRDQSTVVESSREAVNAHPTAMNFHKDAAAGSLENMQILYENRAEKPVSRYELGKAIATAASRGYVLIVKYLIDHGIDTESQMCQKALVQAAENGYFSTVQFLLTAGVSPNSQWKKSRLREGRSCLWAAVDQEHVEIVRLLLDSGADPNTRYNKKSALNTSIKKINEDLFDLLLDKGASTEPIQIEEVQYDTLELPIHYAASVGNIHILRRLLESGLEADDALIKDGWTALFHAAKAGHEEVLRVLIKDYGADVNRRANKGTVAIHTAAYHDHSNCIEVFLEAGVDINVQSNAGQTSLYWAAQKGSIDAVRVLLERGADVFIEEKDRRMKTADIAKAKALEVSESRKSKSRWKEPREENYEPIRKILVEKMAQSKHRSEDQNPSFHPKCPSVVAEDKMNDHFLVGKGG